MTVVLPSYPDFCENLHVAMFWREIKDFWRETKERFNLDDFLAGDQRFLIFGGRRKIRFNFG